MEIDWKKKYEEVLLKMRQLVESGIIDTIYAESLFPELAESEDEKIREEIVSFIRAFWVDHRYSVPQASKWLDWLEKQKETLHIPELCKENADSFTDEDEKIRKELVKYIEDYPNLPSGHYSRADFFAYLEKQKEQKPTVIENLAEHIKAEFEGFRNLLKKKGIDYQPGQIYWDDFAKLFVSSARKYGLQKTVEWSKEDEEHLDSIIESYKELIKDYFANNGVDYIPYNTPVVARTVLNDIKFLKSLLPQSKKEVYLSAKHDLAIKFIVFLDMNRPVGKMCLSNGECKDIDDAFQSGDWTKIMRYVEKYHPHWKPSEEQMKALNALNCYGGISYAGQQNELISLYNDLKKLKK